MKPNPFLFAHDIVSLQLQRQLFVDVAAQTSHWIVFIENVNI